LGTSRGVLKWVDHFPNTATLNRVWQKTLASHTRGIGQTLPKTFQYQRKRFHSPTSFDIFISKSFQRVWLQRRLRFLTSLLFTPKPAGPGLFESAKIKSREVSHGAFSSAFAKASGSPSEPSRLQALRFTFHCTACNCGAFVRRGSSC
jgi:hypothetical protein